MRIIWTKRAWQEWQAISVYIRTEFGLQAQTDFYESTLKWEDTITSMPEIGKIEPISEETKHLYRSVVINRRSKLLYYVKKDTIHIVDFWDTRREHKSR